MSSFWQAAAELGKAAWRAASAWQRSSDWTAVRKPLILQPSVKVQAAQFLTETPHAHGTGSGHTGKEDPERAERIRKETRAWNLNNVTRTQAYWNIYRQFPELHWALLAHLVSRNGGWSMTDLKGEWLPGLMGPEKARLQFELLEMCNALIFGDAYPQLKLYAESRRLGVPLFGLLPRFGVSAFMRPFWERFWRTRDPVPLTVALIVNEQHVIQKPAVEQPKFRQGLLETAAFRALPWLQTNQIVFPLLPAKRKKHPVPPLAGRVLENFGDLKERVAFGKSLYALLFAYPRVGAGAALFAEKIPHTGSRSDYWPELYSPSRARSGWYSPSLAAAWPNQPLPEPPREDWLESFPQAWSWLSSPKPPRIVDMTAEHRLAAQKWQAAARAKDMGP